MAETSTVKNILANYSSKLWGFVSVYLFIPLYIKYLGVEAYAVISFYTVILGIISFADAGLSSAITREFAKINTIAYKFSILKIIEKIYILICVIVVVILFFLSPIIADKWLHTESISIGDLIYYLRLIAVGVVLQLLSSLYFGGLMGMQAQVKSNLIQIVWGITRTIGSIGLFIIYRPSLEVFFLWQIICNIFLILVLRFSLINMLKSFKEQLVMVINKLPMDVRSYVTGMLLIAIISAINIQADKIATSSLFTLEQFGYYSLSSSLAQIPVLLGTPLAATVFPILSRLVSEKKFKSLYKCLANFSFILSILIIPIVITLELYTGDIIKLWMGKTTLNSVMLPQIILIVRLLVIGGMFLALQVLPFYFLLAQGKTKYTVRQGVFQILFGLPALYFFINKYGLVGAGFPWIIINLGSFIYLYYVIFKRYLDLPTYKFLFETLFLPFLISLITAIVGFFVFKNISIKYILIIPVLTSVLSVLINIACFNINRNNKLTDIKSLFSF